MEQKKLRKGGRKPKIDPSTHRYVFRLTDAENSRFLTLFETSGMDTKAGFIVSILFERQIRTVKVDMEAVDFHMRLTHLYGQFRAIGVNYNQVVKMLYRNFSEKKAAAYLFKLEKHTQALAEICKQIMQLTKAFERDYLGKSSQL